MENLIKNEAKNLLKTKGITFSLDELRTSLKISKKTIYKYFTSKEDLLKSIIDEAYNDLKTKQKKVLEKSIDLLTKIKSILRIMPINNELFTNENIRDLNVYFPDLMNYVKTLFESDWEVAYELIDEAKNQNLIYPIDNELLKHLYINGFLYNFHENISYNDRINQLIQILFIGVEKQ